MLSPRQISIPNDSAKILDWIYVLLANKLYKYKIEENHTEHRPNWTNEWNDFPKSLSTLDILFALCWLWAVSSKPFVLPKTLAIQLATRNLQQIFDSDWVFHYVSWKIGTECLPMKYSCNLCSCSWQFFE